jgi:flotillin
MEAHIKQARAKQDQMRAKYLADTNIKESERDLAIKKAGYKIETDTKKAEAQIAYSLQKAISQQEIMRQEMQIKVIEKEKDIQIQEQNVLRQVARLEAEVKKPAEAESYRMETTALGEKNKKLLEAQAEAEAIEIRAKADAAALYMTGKAEAEAMELKANSFNEYKEAAMVQMVMDALPKIAKACASPLMQANKITMVAGDNGDVGAERMTQEVLNIMAAMPITIEQMTGINPFSALQNSSAASSSA